ncbi:hypothetical protein AYO40_00990 [Planctomycetaceae bacterium SCGC AG-212-D15]|nr:hypothetical protein AYO40_00990 [Planctomycetaceae bacterium SCGC AG-212-D15]
MNQPYKVSETVEVEKPLIDAVIEATQARKVEVPKGWLVLPAGVKRQIKINRYWLSDPKGGYWTSDRVFRVNAPYVVIENGIEKYYYDVQIKGAVKMACQITQTYAGCAGSVARGMAWVETEEEILVRVE